jgi:transposase InsO family protein
MTLPLHQVITTRRPHTPPVESSPPTRSKVTGALAALTCVACCALPLLITAGVLTTSTRRSFPPLRRYALNEEQQCRHRAEATAAANDKAAVRETRLRQTAEADARRTTEAYTTLEAELAALREQLADAETRRLRRTRRTPSTRGGPLIFEGAPVPEVAGVGPPPSWPCSKHVSQPRRHAEGTRPTGPGHRPHHPPGTRRAIFHSDRGSDYTSAEFGKVLHGHGIRQSVGRTGICYDNAIRKADDRVRPLVPTRSCARGRSDLRSAVRGGRTGERRCTATAARTGTARVAATWMERRGHTK